ncbi:conserved hypothetical protein [Rhodopseudomonas palustris HaA2]|uniref:Uncharacterized protein n=1 Tax=Rhodopseudomonas palustris (strain HaA2) TaxID=316058 RepID=Q2IUE4_RHOP2|nr:hypothetical protein [Rhodopseudomonas palustris]ABD08166.1 conserved hypothetical protein [Rhodopseudomonas palustris HaA2]
MRLAALLLLSVIAAPAARAADLPMHSKIGRIFAEPVPRGRVVALVPPPRDVISASPVYAPEVDIPPIVHGYYGKPNSYHYFNYYGTPASAIYSRLPYACGWYGYC